MSVAKKRAYDLPAERERQRIRREADPEPSRRACRAWRAKNADARREYQRMWRAKNPGRHAAAEVRRQAARLQRTPVWVDMKKIEAIYAEAAVMTAMMGEPWHVDHVIPLRGKNVSGLHVHGNLQLLPGTENVRKHNRYIVA